MEIEEITLEMLDRHFGFKSYFELYKWLKSSGHSDKTYCELKTNKFEVVMDNAIAKKPDFVTCKFRIADVKAAAMDEIYNFLPTKEDVYKLLNTMHRIPQDSIVDFFHHKVPIK